MKPCLGNPKASIRGGFLGLAWGFKMPANALPIQERPTLPLNSLLLSDANVRKTSPSYIENLAASVLSDGVLQNLIVVPTKKKKGAAVTYEIVAGKRRYLALVHLLNDGKIPPDYPVPVLLKERNNATVSSLVENFHREPMHPIDEFKAFSSLANEGLSVTEISLKLGVPITSVRQRLALGSASPELLDECLNNRMSLEQLKVMCQVDSHERQNEVWFNTPEGWHRNPPYLREIIRGEVVKVSHKLVAFIGLQNYQENGGSVNFDLFDDSESVINDPDLLSSLAVNKLTALVDSLGWSWYEVSLDADHDWVRGFKRIFPTDRDMTETEEATWNSWEERLIELQELLEYDEEELTGNGFENTHEPQHTEYKELVAIMDAFQTGLKSWGNAKEYGGVYAYVDSQGEACFIEGLVRKQDGNDPETDNSMVAEKGMPASLKEYLACVRSCIMQAEIVKNPRIGMALLCHSLVLGTFYRASSIYNFLDISVSSHSTALDKHDLGDIPSIDFLLALRDKWQARLPDEPELLTFLLTLECSEFDELMVFCSSYALTLHCCREDAQARYSLLTGLLGTNIANFWHPTATNFFSRINKTLIFDILNSAGINTNGLSDKMKKAELAVRAEALIKQNPDWLPDVLTTDLVNK
jgi:ParB family transcriptional regulator, chromosome partitioning protein